MTTASVEPVDLFDWQSVSSTVSLTSIQWDLNRILKEPHSPSLADAEAVQELVQAARREEREAAAVIAENLYGVREKYRDPSMDEWDLASDIADAIRREGEEPPRLEVK